MIAIAALLLALPCSPAPVATTPEPPRSSDWVAALPPGETRRKVVLGCSPCHAIGLPVSFRTTRADWDVVIQRMKKIDDDLELSLIPFHPVELSEWLATNAKVPATGAAVATSPCEVTEYPAGAGKGFYHDMALAGGRAWIADYFGNVLYGVDPATGKVEEFAIPVTVAAPGKPAGAHAIDVTRDGMLWICFTKSEQVARFDPKKREFRMYSGYPKGGSVQYFCLDAERYVYQDAKGGIWTTHFSKEILCRLDPATGEIQSHPMKRTEGLPEKGVHLYASVADSKGRLWYTETHGNRLGVFDPATKENEEYEIFESWAGPKRLAVDLDDRLWIPQLASGKITVYDARARKVLRELPLPIEGDYVYAIRRNRFTGELWASGAGSDSLYRIDPKNFSIRTYRLPRRGAYTRTFDFLPDGSVWTCYSSFPNAQTVKPFDAGVIVKLVPRD